MTAITLLDDLESRGIRLSLAGDEIYASFLDDSAELSAGDREWIIRFRDDLTAVLKVREMPAPANPMPASPTWRTRIALWPEQRRRRWAQLVLDHQLAGFDQEEAEWRAWHAVSRHDEDEDHRTRHGFDTISPTMRKDSDSRKRTNFHAVLLLRKLRQTFSGGWKRAGEARTLLRLRTRDEDSSWAGQSRRGSRRR